MNKDMLPTYALICELYVGQSMQIKEIALELAIDVNHVHRALNAYLNKPTEPEVITVESIINNRTAYVIHMWDRLRTKDIAEDLSVHPSTIWEICRRVGINNKNRVMPKGWVMPELKTCIILNNETGIYYFNEQDLADAHNLKKRTLNSYFNGETNAKRHHKFMRMPLN